MDVTKIEWDFIPKIYRHSFQDHFIECDCSDENNLHRHWRGFVVADITDLIPEINEIIMLLENELNGMIIDFGQVEKTYVSNHNKNSIVIEFRYFKGILHRFDLDNLEEEANK